LPADSCQHCWRSSMAIHAVGVGGGRLCREASVFG
jgi:hypothetical protein